jgi:hypothetical protein
MNQGCRAVPGIRVVIIILQKGGLKIEIGGQGDGGELLTDLVSMLISRRLVSAANFMRCRS